MVVGSSQQYGEVAAQALVALSFAAVGFAAVAPAARLAAGLAVVLGKRGISRHERRWTLRTDEARILDAVSRLRAVRVYIALRLGALMRWLNGLG